MCFAALFGLKFYRAYQVGKNIQQPSESVQFTSAPHATNVDKALHGAHAQAEPSGRTNNSWFAQAAQVVMDKVKTQLGVEPEPDATAPDLQKQVDAWEIAANQNAGQPRGPS